MELKLRFNELILKWKPMKVNLKVESKIGMKNTSFMTKTGQISCLRQLDSCRARLGGDGNADGEKAGRGSAA